MIQTDNPQKLVLRTAIDADAPFIRKISDEAFNNFGDYGDVVLKWFESEYSRTVIALYKEISAGFVMLSYPFDRYDLGNSSEMLAIAVSSEYRGMGIGSTLLKRIDELAYEMGIEIIFLHTATENNYAVKLFSGSGFTVYRIKKNFYPKGQDAFVMTKNIKWPGESLTEDYFGPDSR